MNLTKNQIVIIAPLIVVVVAYFMFFRKKKVTTTQMAAPAESSWSPEYASDAIALATARGGYAGTESGYDGLPKPEYGKMPTDWLRY